MRHKEAFLKCWRRQTNGQTSSQMRQRRGRVIRDPPDDAGPLKTAKTIEGQIKRRQPDAISAFMNSWQISRVTAPKKRQRQVPLRRRDRPAVQRQLAHPRSNGVNDVGACGQCAKNSRRAFDAHECTAYLLCVDAFAQANQCGQHRGTPHGRAIAFELIAHDIG